MDSLPDPRPNTRQLMVSKGTWTVQHTKGVPHERVGNSWISRAFFYSLLAWHKIMMGLWGGERYENSITQVAGTIACKAYFHGKERGESRAALLREAIETFIAGDNHTPKGSCLDLAKDLLGCMKGPIDLSFQKKHMRGYGKWSNAYFGHRATCGDYQRR